MRFRRKKGAPGEATFRPPVFSSAIAYMPQTFRHDKRSAALSSTTVVGGHHCHAKTSTGRSACARVIAECGAPRREGLPTRKGRRDDGRREIGSPSDLRPAA